MAEGYPSTSFGPSRPGLPVITDSDATSDSDDAVLMCEAIAFEQRGELDLRACVTDTYNTASAPALNCILTYAGMGNIPVGAFQSATTPTDTQAYATAITGNLPASIFPGNNGLTAGSSFSSVTVARKALSKLPTITSNYSGATYHISGAWSALNYLLNSPSDQYGPAGSTLFAQKIGRVWVMGGSQTTGTEHNLSLDPASSAAALATLNTLGIPRTWFPGQMGSTFSIDPTTYVVSGSPFSLVNPGTREQWDFYSFYLMVRGLSYNGNTYATKTQGTQVINSITGANTFTAGAGNDYMLSYAAGGQTQLVADVTTLMQQSAGGGPNPQSSNALTGNSVTTAGTITSTGSGPVLNNTPTSTATVGTLLTCIAPNLGAGNNINIFDLGTQNAPHLSFFGGYHHVGSTGDNVTLGMFGSNNQVTWFDGGDVGINTATDNGQAFQVTGNISLNAAGNGLRIKGGTNARANTNIAYSSGTVTISNASVDSGTIIQIFVHTPGGTVGQPVVTSRTNGTGFTVTSTTGSADTSTIDYLLTEQN